MRKSKKTKAQSRTVLQVVADWLALDGGKRRNGFRASFTKKTLVIQRVDGGIEIP